MLIQVFRFNTYLLLALAMILGNGCHAKGPKPKPKLDKHDEASLRFHLEVNPDGSDGNAPVLIGHADPFPVNVEKIAFLTEMNISHASVVDALGGYSLSIQFDPDGTTLLNQYTTANRGKRIGIAAECGYMRWLAAPVISRGMTDGVFVFTPDATREETERIASGLNRVADLVAKGKK